jgi:hypothetical protein
MQQVTRIFWQRHFEFNQLPKARPARKCRDTGIKKPRIGAYRLESSGTVIAQIFPMPPTIPSADSASIDR